MNENAIRPTSDRKTRFYKNQMNTFGLMPGDPAEGGTCPGCTKGPGGCWYLAPGRMTHECYVDGLMRCYSGIKAVLQHNTDLLRNAGSVAAMADILDAEFKRFEDAEFKRATKTGQPLNNLYRLHWSGDVFSLDYAEALKRAMLRHPDIRFWAYTRTFEAVPILHQVPNLILYLSLDPCNIADGLIHYDDNGQESERLQVCYMAGTNDFGDMKAGAVRLLNARNAVRGMLNLKVKSRQWLEDLTLTPCPVDSKKIPMEEGCSKCKRCYTPGQNPAWFET